MPTARGGAATGVIAGKLYVASGGNTTALEVYDPGSNGWTTRAPIPTNRAYAGADVIAGRLYVVGGCVNSDCRIGVTSTLEMYDPATNTWTTRAAMPTARAAMAAGVIAGKLYVVGGFQACYGPCPIYNTLEVYDPATNSWTTKAPMPTARAQMGGAVINGKLYVVGGTTNGTAPGRLATLEVYDPATDAWTTNAPMPTARFGLGAGEVNGILYAVSGVVADYIHVNTVEAYNPATDTWTAVAPIPTARDGPQPRGINGVLYVAGNGLGGASIATLEAFTPEVDVPPLVIPSTTPQVSLGQYHDCALKLDGTVVCWGYNSDGQATVPAGLNSVVQVSAGGYHNCVLKTDGTVVCWGYNLYGQTTLPSGLSPVAQVSAGLHHTCALRTNGTVACWGANSASLNFGQTTVPVGLASVVQVGAGYLHSCALKANGTVVCWGGNADGQVTVPAGLSSVSQISTEIFHTCALKAAGTVVCWGKNDSGQSTVPAGLTSVTLVTVGGYHTCALKSDRTVVCWGLNTDGQSTVPSGLTSVAQVDAGQSHTCALKTDGTVVCWGRSGEGQGSAPAGLNLGSIFVAQSIAFTSSAPSPALTGGTYTVAATGGASGNAVTFSSLTPDVCTVAGNMVRLIAVGACTVAADQAAGTGYMAAPQVTQTFTVGAATTTTTVSLAPTTVEYNHSITLGATVLPATVAGSALSGTVQFQIDGLNAGAPQALSGSGTATLADYVVTLSSGIHSLTASFTSTNPNFGGSTSTGVTFTVTRDVTPPATTINSAVDGNGAAITNGTPTLSSSIAFIFSGTDDVGVVGFQCSVDGTPYATCSSPATYSGVTVGTHTFGVSAVDAAGNVAARTMFAWTVVTPAQAVQNIVGAVAGMGLPAGVANSLSAPLNNFNPNNLTAACGKLNAFINQLDAKLKNGQLTPSEGDPLRQSANAIKNSLGCA